MMMMMMNNRIAKKMLNENQMTRYLRYKHISAATRLRMTETEAANAFTRRASVGIEVGHLAYTRGR